MCEEQSQNHPTLEYMGPMTHENGSLWSSQGGSPIYGSWPSGDLLFLVNLMHLSPYPLGFFMIIATSTLNQFHV